MQTEAAEFIDALPAALKKRITKRIKKAAASSSSEMDFPKLADSIGGQIRMTSRR